MATSRVEPSRLLATVDWPSLQLRSVALTWSKDAQSRPGWLQQRLGDWSCQYARAARFASKSATGLMSQRVILWALGQ
jgi:hypothetical protein